MIGIEIKKEYSQHGESQSVGFRQDHP